MFERKRFFLLHEKCYQKVKLLGLHFFLHFGVQMFYKISAKKNKCYEMKVSCYEKHVSFYANIFQFYVTKKQSILMLWTRKIQMLFFLVKFLGPVSTPLKKS